MNNMFYNIFKCGGNIERTIRIHSIRKHLAIALTALKASPWAIFDNSQEVYTAEMYAKVNIAWGVTLYFRSSLNTFLIL